MSINAINFNTPFLLGVPNSRVSPEWIRLIAAIFGDGGPAGMVGPDALQAYVFTSRKPVSQDNAVSELQRAQATVASLRNLVSDLGRRISDVEAMLAQPKKAFPLDRIGDVESMMLKSKTASSSDSVAVIDDVATNLTVYPLWSDGLNGNRRPRTSSTQWTFNPSTGTMSAVQLVATAGFGCNGATPQTAFASGGAAPAGGVGAAAGGWDTAAHRDSAITLINNIRSALVACGIMT